MRRKGVRHGIVGVIRSKGSTMTPDSDLLTIIDSAACCSGAGLRWTKPMPPSSAMAMANRPVVTVTMGASRWEYSWGSGTSVEPTSTGRAETSLYPRHEKDTSSKVYPFVGDKFFLETHENLLGKAANTMPFRGDRGRERRTPLA